MICCCHVAAPLYLLGYFHFSLNYQLSMYLPPFLVSVKLIIVQIEKFDNSLPLFCNKNKNVTKSMANSCFTVGVHFVQLLELYFYYIEHRECYEIVLLKSYFHSRKMDATTTSPQVPSKFSDVCNLLFDSRSKNFTPTPVRKNTIVKYAKLPDNNFSSKGKFHIGMYNWHLLLTLELCTQQYQ